MLSPTTNPPEPNLFHFHKTYPVYAQKSSTCDSYSKKQYHLTSMAALSNMLGLLTAAPPVPDLACVSMGHMSYLFVHIIVLIVMGFDLFSPPEIQRMSDEESWN